MNKKWKKKEKITIKKVKKQIKGGVGPVGSALANIVRLDPIKDFSNWLSSIIEK